MSCTTAIETKINNGLQFETWKTQTLADINTLASKNGVLSASELTQLQALESDLFNTINCIRLKTENLRTAPTNVSTIQEQIVGLQKEIDLKEGQYEVAKERAKSILNPEQKVSDYEGWFPIGRPMRSTSLFILIGFSIFFILFFFGLLMSFLGFQIQLSWVPKFQMPGVKPQIPWLAMLWSWINPLTLAAITALLVTGGFLIYSYTK
jgi:hypothetical protein